MHRYFARRPYSVFERLVEHYSNPGDVVLDPFCGGGVTIVEGALQGRRTIGVDINPLSTFVTRTEVEPVDLVGLAMEIERVLEAYRERERQIFRTACRRCDEDARALWFEYSAVTGCPSCGKEFLLADAEKVGSGKWSCTCCSKDVRFSAHSSTRFDVVAVHYDCRSCGHGEVAPASAADRSLASEVPEQLRRAEEEGLWVPQSEIPDCNMQRESALHKKGVTHFRHLFTDRHLLALGLLKETILDLHSPFQDWLLLTFSATLRYTNRMVTRNANWRGTRPLEWAKPGFWLPAVHLEANVAEEFARRGTAVVRGKRDYMARVASYLPVEAADVADVLSGQATYQVTTASSTQLPLPDGSVDVVITDPPYGSYVHYADLSNFWAVWLPEVAGLGHVIDDTEEAVIARKKFPGAKSASDYEALLTRCLAECARVLRPDVYLVLTFHNREPRAWAALLVAAARAGFDLPEGGLIFQDGVAEYKHTAQSRRAGSVIGDFILSFVKAPLGGPTDDVGSPLDEEKAVGWVKEILSESGPCTPTDLMTRFYMRAVPEMLRHIRAALQDGQDAVDGLVSQFDSLTLFDSHRKQLMERHFGYTGTHWELSEEHDAAAA